MTNQRDWFAPYRNGAVVTAEARTKMATAIAEKPDHLSEADAAVALFAAMDSVATNQKLQIAELEARIAVLTADLEQANAKVSRLEDVVGSLKQLAGQGAPAQHDQLPAPATIAYEA